MNTNLILTPEALQKHIPPEIMKQIPGEWLKLPVAELVSKLTATIQQKERQNQIVNYKPYPKQLEFHKASLSFKIILLRAISQVGKTRAAAQQTAYHVTGDYPAWWPGRRFVNATRGWVLSESMQFSRDTVQKLLLGESPEEWGPNGPGGIIPGNRIKKIIRASHSVPDAVDSVRIKHISGGTSTILFKSGEVETNRLGGDTLDWAWADEEPDYDKFEELLTRTNVRNGPVIVTFTPLKGSTKLVNELIDRGAKGNSGVADVCWTIDDESHYSPERKAELREQYKHSPQRDARLYAKPQLGSGTVFQGIDEDAIKFNHIDITDYWYRICGMDFGIQDPTVLVWLAHDRENDCYYLYDCYGQTDKPAAVHYEAWKARGENIPVAWPADGLKRGHGDGRNLGMQLSRIYEELGMLMLDEPAMLPERDITGETTGSRTSVEAGLAELVKLMDQGRFKVAAHLEGWWNEFRLYHRNEQGILVDKHNHYIDATRMALVMEMQGLGQSGGRYRKLSGMQRRHRSSRYG